MILTDLVTLEQLQLPNDLMWVDEFNWSPVASTHTYTLAGALIIEQGVKQAGRPITLRSEQDDMAWVTRQTAQRLKAFSAIAGRLFKLKFEYPTDSREFQVMFSLDTAEAVTASPVKGFPGHQDGDWFKIAMKLLEVV